MSELWVAERLLLSAGARSGPDGRASFELPTVSTKLVVSKDGTKQGLCTKSTVPRQQMERALLHKKSYQSSGLQYSCGL